MKVYIQSSSIFEPEVIRSLVAVAGCSVFCSNPLVHVVFHNPPKKSNVSYQPSMKRFITIVSYLNKALFPHQWILILIDQYKNHVVALHSSEICWSFLRDKIIEMVKANTQSISRFSFFFYIFFNEHK